jgi:hypothetical protein
MGQQPAAPMREGGGQRTGPAWPYRCRPLVKESTTDHPVSNGWQSIHQRGHPKAVLAHGVLLFLSLNVYLRNELLAELIS